MPAAINSNLNSLAAQRQLAANANSLGTAMQRLSSGLRINGAKDDAAGLAISERFTTQINGTNQAARNANDGISLAQTADGALASISNNLQRIRELAVQSANGTQSASDRAGLQAEAAQLIAENDRIATQTEFNGTKLLDGTFSAQQFQVGANRAQTVSTAAIGSMRSNALGTSNGFDIMFVNPTVGAASNLSVTLNGAGTTYNLGPVATDAQAIIDAINGAGIPGLTASGIGQSRGLSANMIGAVSGIGVLTINGIAIPVSYTVGNMQANLDNAVAAINAQSAAAGVQAQRIGNMMNLYAVRDTNLVVSYSAGTATGSVSTDFGIQSGQFSSFPIFRYEAPLGTGVSSVDISGAGLGTVSTAVMPMGSALNTLDISSTAGATTAITSTDAALRTVSATRAALGALQNRFASTISNLQSSSENMSAARSRIVDADFAQETATLSRAQILQQASSAMVAQANQSPQGVLALLR